MPTLAETLQETNDALTALADYYQTKADVIDARIEAQVAEARALKLSVVGTLEVAIDAVNGDDNNTGTVASPFKTWDAVVAKLEGNRATSIVLLSDVVMSKRFTLGQTPARISISGRNSVGAATRRKLSFVNSLLDPTSAGGFFFNGALSLNISDVDLEMAYSASVGPLRMIGSTIYVQLSNSNITRTGTGAALFGGTFAGHVQVSATTIDPSAAGYVFHNVAAGADPNAVVGLTSNLTSA